MDSINISKFYPQIVIFLIGLIFIGGSLLIGKINPFSSSSKIEIINEPSSSPGGFVVSEIAGAVLKPGVYQLPVGSRISDLLIASGGISDNADREYVERSINRASKLNDGQKIYIPQRSEVLSASEESSKFQITNSKGEKLNINDASISELDMLPGIGPVYAQKIVEQKPYSDINELLTKEVIPANVFEKIKEKITTY